MATKTSSVTAAVNSPGSLVLQWLTYAFWGWTVLSLAWLTAISVGFYLDTTHDGSETTTIAYSLAAVVVLFLISLLCDVFYTRREPLHKQGAATVIMIIHAVLFALLGIGSLIIAVFAVVRLLIGDSPAAGSYGDSGALTTLITGLVIAIVYGATLLRTLRPFKLARSSVMYWVFMFLVTAGVVALSIAGPAWNARLTRDDRLIEGGLGGVSEAIRTYTAKTDALPKTLADVRDQTTGNARTLIDRGLVEYKAGTKLPAPQTNPPSLEKPIVMPAETGSFTYTLCVTYRGSKGTHGPTPMLYKVNEISPDTYYHAAGRVCYNLQTSYGNFY